MDVIMILLYLQILTQDHLDYHKTMEEYNMQKACSFPS